MIQQRQGPCAGFIHNGWCRDRYDEHPVTTTQPVFKGGIKVRSGFYSLLFSLFYSLF
jgi:hypothetical protein